MQKKKIDKLDEMDKFLERHKLTQEEIDNLNRQETELVIINIF